MFHGKASLYNHDGDYQTGNCKLFLSLNGSNFFQVDATQVRVGQKDDADQTGIPLLASRYVGSFGIARLTCGTYDGQVYSSVLTAIEFPD